MSSLAQIQQFLQNQMKNICVGYKQHQLSEFSHSQEYQTSSNNIFINRQTIYKHLHRQQRLKYSSPQSQNSKSMMTLSHFKQFKHKLKQYLFKEKSKVGGSLFNKQIQKLTDNSWYVCTDKLAESPLHKNKRKSISQSNKNRRTLMENFLHSSQKINHSKNKNNVYNPIHSSVDLKHGPQEKNVQYINRLKAISQQQLFKQKAKTEPVMQRPLYVQYLKLERQIEEIDNLQKKQPFIVDKLDNFSRIAEKRIKQIQKLKSKSKYHEKGNQNIFQSQHSQVLIYTKDSLKIQQLQRKKKQLLNISKRIQFKKSKPLRIRISKKADVDLAPWSKCDFYDQDLQHHNQKDQVKIQKKSLE